MIQYRALGGDPDSEEPWILSFFSFMINPFDCHLKSLSSPCILLLSQHLPILCIIPPAGLVALTCVPLVCHPVKSWLSRHHPNVKGPCECFNASIPHFAIPPIFMPPTDLISLSLPFFIQVSARQDTHEPWGIPSQTSVQVDAKQRDLYDWLQIHLILLSPHSEILLNVLLKPRDTLSTVFPHCSSK